MEGPLAENQGQPPLWNNVWIKRCIIGLIILAFTLYVGQSWKGEAGVPWTDQYDFDLHGYRVWTAAEHLKSSNLFFDFDYKSNALLTRSYPFLPHVIAAVFVIMGGSLLNGISYYILFCIFLLGLGAFLLGRALKLSNLSSLFLSLSLLLSYGLALETQYAAGLHRLLAFALLPWILAVMLSEHKKLKLLIPVLLGIAILSHALSGMHIAFITAVFFLFTQVQSKTSIKSITPLVTWIVLAAGIAAAFLLPLYIEYSNGYLNTPDYLTGQGTRNLGQGKTVPTAFLTRQFGFTDGGVYGYLGIALIGLALIGCLKKNKLRLPIALLIIFYTTLMTFPTLFPAFIQGEHYSKNVLTVSFLVTILAAIGLEGIFDKINQKLQIKATHVKYAVATLIFVIVLIDLAPGLTSFPLENALTRLAPNIITENGRIYFGSDQTFRQIDSTFVENNFIQYIPEVINKEYASFLAQLDSESKQENFSALLSNSLALLNVNTFLRPGKITGNRKEYQVANGNTLPVIVPTRTILINYNSKAKSEQAFEYILSQNYTNVYKIGFLLQGNGITEQDVDYVLVENKTKQNEITIADLANLFESTTSKAVSDFQVKDNTIQFQATQSGFAFVSHMWYPHFKATNSKIYEAGGGLTAIKVENPGEVIIYWEKPWYDYLAALISIATLAIIAYLWRSKKAVDFY